MNKYEIACALSHIKTIQHCYNQGLEYALILEDDATFEYFAYKTDTILCLLKELNSVNGECLQLGNTINRKVFTRLNFSKKFIKLFVGGAQSYLITREGMKKVLNNFNNLKKIEVSEIMIFNVANTFITAPYFSYPFLINEKGDKVNTSTIRLNTKSDHATQTISKQLWDNYYKNLK